MQEKTKFINNEGYRFTYHDKINKNKTIKGLSAGISSK
jgi:hypothetical protein